MNRKVINLLDKLKKVGTIALPKGRESFLRSFYRKDRAHMSFSHYPIGLFPFAFVMAAIYAYSGDVSFFKASEYASICGCVMLIPVALSGITTYRANFKTEPAGNFNIKMKKLLTPIVTVLALVLLILFRYQSVEAYAMKLITLAIIWLMLLILESNGKQLIFKEMEDE